MAASTNPSGNAYPSFTTVNFYAGSKLNRLSWLRTSTEFLNSTITSPATRFVLLKDNNPLCHAQGENQGLLATLSWEQVKPYVLENVRLSGGVQAAAAPAEKGEQQQEEEEEEEEEVLVFGPQAYGLKNAKGDAAGEKEFSRATDGVGPSRLALVFLGIDESKLQQSSLPGEMAKSDESPTESGSGSGGQKKEKAETPAGVPYFALSLTYRPPFLSESDASPLQPLLSKLEEQKDTYDFIDLRASSRASTWPAEEAAIVAQAKSLIDWNERHQYCPGCSRQQYSLWSGYKRGCSSSLSTSQLENNRFAQTFLSNGKHASFEQDGLGVCPSTKVLSNFHYPRTDPVIIMAIISPDGEKVLLGRQKKWPKGFYSCLAGFCEPGESFEEAVRREVLEESGIQVDQVIYHSSQPWPYPTNLMAGFYGIAKTHDPNQIRLDLDNELEDARFYTKSQMLDVIRRSEKKKDHLTKAELAKMMQEHPSPGDEDKKEKGEEEEEERVNIRLPPETAIARVLIEAWAKGHAVLPTHMDSFQKTRM